MPGVHLYLIYILYFCKQEHLMLYSLNEKTIAAWIQKAQQFL